jgi:hypothetical protein
MRESANENWFAGLVMGQHAVSPELLELGHDTVGRLARELATGAPLVRLQLVASRFYEEIRDELERTPAADGAKVGLLAAAVDRCRRSTDFGIAPAVALGEFKAIIGMLTGAPPEPPPQGRPQLRVIRGGLA